MPTIYDSPPTLTLVSSNPWPHHRQSRPREHDVNQETLLQVAPDREELFNSNKSITELRQCLKIRVGTTENHWIYRNRKRVSANLKEGNARISTLIRGPPVESPASQKDIHFLRRVLSASALSQFTQPLRLDGHSCPPSDEQDVDLWGLTLSTTEKLISPRPLGPTHILIVHSIPGPSRVFQPVKGGGRKPLRRKKSTALSNVTEIPINDLLFVLNVPNVRPVVPILPPRLHKELPRVLMFVPHVETFPELVVYLHTQNQAQLIRAIIPEWIRDLMHPLPEPVNTPISDASPSLDGKAIVKVPMQILGLLIPRVAPSIELESLSSVQSPTHVFKRTIESVAEEIACAASPSNEKDARDPVFATMACLNALRDNLDHIGYYADELWQELDSYREVLIRAVSFQAKIREKKV